MDLCHSLQSGKKDKKKGVWLKLKSPEDIDLINESVKNHGFQFHSVDHQGGTVVEVASETESSLPIGPSFYAGVGVVCISKDDKILPYKRRMAG